MKTHSILIVDDEHSILRSLERLLRNEDYQTYIAIDAATALEILETTPIDIVISDQRMPCMTGTEFLTVVKDKYPHIIRILFSGYLEFESIISAINDASVSRFITKPWDNKELIAILDTLVAQESTSRIAAEIIGKFIKTLKPIDEVKCSVIKNNEKIELLVEYADKTFLRDSIGIYLEKIKGAIREINRMLREQMYEEVSQISLVVYGGEEVIMKLDLPAPDNE